MNQDSNFETPDIQEGKPVTYKRGSRAGRNRPVLVTAASNDQAASEQAAQDASEVTQPAEEGVSTTPVETPRERRLPNFFSTVGKSEKEQTTAKTDTVAARMARATRGFMGSSTSSRKNKESKAVEAGTPATPPARVASPRTSAPPRRAGGFKMKYVFGMILYLLLADVIGVYERSFLVSNKLEGLIFQLGPVPVYRSTILFLITLVVILVILARFDLVPRSLGAMAGQSAPQRNPGQTESSSGSNSNRSQQPTMKQGVKGADDDLYQEYRENQRYLQRRERKR